MPRRRIGDGTSPYLLGRIILDLVECERARERAHDGGIRLRAGHDGAAPPRTATNLAAGVGLTPTQVRVAANELVRARCLRRRRMTTTRMENSGRYSQGYFLPAPAEERGPGRNPRLRPVALLIESNRVIMDAMGRVLRELGALPVGVSELSEARRVLEHLGFELVVLGGPGEAWAGMGPADDLGRAAWAARCGPVIARGSAVEGADVAARRAGIGPLGLAGFRVAAAAALGIPLAAGTGRDQSTEIPDEGTLALAFE